MRPSPNVLFSGLTPPTTPKRILREGKVGPSCAKLIEFILQSRPHPEMGFRSVLAIMRLGKGVGEARLEAALR
jgi:hypothetical protein